MKPINYLETLVDLAEGTNLSYVESHYEVNQKNVGADTQNIINECKTVIEKEMKALEIIRDCKLDLSHACFRNTRDVYKDQSYIVYCNYCYKNGMKMPTKKDFELVKEVLNYE